MKSLVPLTLSLFLISLNIHPCRALIPRQSLVSKFNPTRNASSLVTPMQVGNGNFAFGADVTGLQTFQPFNILSSWGWKNDSLPPGTTQVDIDDYHGASLLNHGRPVEYDFGGPEPIQQWLIANPNRADLGRVGFVLLDPDDEAPRAIGAEDVSEAHQTLDLWTGALTSTFTLAPFADAPVTVRTACDPTHNALTIAIASPTS